MTRGWARQLGAITLVALAYFATAKVGLAVAAAHPVVSSLWPAAGVALFALLRYGPHLWPGIALCVLVLNLHSGVPPLGALGIAAGAALGAVAATLLLRRLGLRPGLDRLMDVVALTLIGGVGAAAVSATVGVASLVVSGSAAPEAYPRLWVIWCAGDAVGILAVAPLLLTWSHPVEPSGTEAFRSPWRRAELVLSLAAFSGLAAFVLEPRHDASYALFPALGWIGGRFGRRGVAAGVAVVAVVAAVGALAGRSPFGSVPEPAFLRLQLFVGALAVANLAFAATLAERDASLQAERRARTLAEETRDRLGAIQSVTDAALARFGAEDLLGELLARLRDALGSDFVSVFLLGPDERSLVRRAASGFSGDHPDDRRVPLGRGLAGRVAAEGRALIVDDLTREDVVSPFVREHGRSYIGAPLMVEGRVIGVVTSVSARVAGFTVRELQLLQLVADRVAPAIESTRLLEELQTSQRQLEKASRQLVQVQELERARLARELHDHVGQLLTGLLLMVDALARDPSPSRRSETLRAVEELIAQVRDLSTGLRPPTLEELGLSAALPAHFERFTNQTGLVVHFEHSGLERRLAPDQELGVFRIVQESLTNVARHAGTSRAWVTVRIAGGQVEARIRDQGPGFDLDEAAARGGSGLAGMRERARVLGGALAVTSSEAGTSVEFRLPVQHVASEVIG